MHRSCLYLIVLDVSDLDRATAFWCAALGGSFDPSVDNDPAVYARINVPGTSTRLLLQRVDDEKLSKNRCHIDIATDDVDAEVERLLGVGATRLRSFPGDPGCDFWVLQDPFGNEFCVVTAEHADVLDHGTGWS
jgi:predicted enzyme related to lactoylglutathione lyase